MYNLCHSELNTRKHAVRIAKISLHHLTFAMPKVQISKPRSQQGPPTLSNPHNRLS